MKLVIYDIEYDIIIVLFFQQPYILFHHNYHHQLVFLFFYDNNMLLNHDKYLFHLVLLNHLVELKILIIHMELEQYILLFNN